MVQDVNGILDDQVGDFLLRGLRKESLSIPLNGEDLLGAVVEPNQDLEVLVLGFIVGIMVKLVALGEPVEVNLEQA